jgi:rubrerythrin
MTNAEISTAFDAALEAEKYEDGNLFALIDNGTLDTVLRCPDCGAALAFPTREDALYFLTDDRQCWLCD